MVGGWWLKYFLCFWRLVASSGLFKLSVSPLPFKRTIPRPSIRPATPILTPPTTPQNSTFLCLCGPHNHQKFSAFSYFRPFSDRTDLARRKNVAVSVSNAAFSPRNSSIFAIFRPKTFSAEKLLGRKIFRPFEDFRQNWNRYYLEPVLQRPHYLLESAAPPRRLTNAKMKQKNRPRPNQDLNKALKLFAYPHII